MPPFAIHIRREDPAEEEKLKSGITPESIEQRLERELRLARLEMQLLYESRVMRLMQLWATHVSGSLPGRFVEKALERFLLSPTGGKSAPIPSGSRGLGSGFSAGHQLDEILARHSERRGIIVFFPTVDWNVPLYQRPQHMARRLSDMGYLFFYVTPCHYERVQGFLPLISNLYLTDQLDLLCRRLQGAFFDLYSTSPVPSKYIAAAQRRNFLIYEYIDHIDEQISGRKARYLRDRHASIDPSLAVASAGRLHAELLGRFGEQRTLLLPNAADYDHFHIHRDESKLPYDLRPIVRRGRPIIGYYGALASWIDFDLLNRLAEARPHYELVLIGVDYDGSLRRLRPYANVHFLGRKHYSLLPEYAVWFDVAMIPFVAGPIAQTTSPLKLFEYMALGKPVVTTDMEECRRFRSVIRVRDKAAFAAAVDKALAIREDPAFLATVNREARENTWRARAELLDEALQAILRGARK